MPFTIPIRARGLDGIRPSPHWLRRLRIVAGMVFLALATSGWPQAWHIPGAVGRITVHRTRDATWPAGTGYVEVWPCGLDAAHCNATVIRSSGQKVPSSLLWTATGEPLKVLFDTSSGDTDYFVYLDEVSGYSTWHPEAGLILETRASKGGAFENWEKAWATFIAAKPVLGRSLVPSVFHGIHPHGPTENFLAYYRGFLNVRQPGEYQFCTASTGISYLRLDGKLVAHRPATGPRGERGEHSGKVTLKPGRHLVEYLHAHRTGELTMEMGWKPPGAPHFVLVPAKAFVPVARFDTISFDPAPGQPRRVCLEWETRGHNLLTNASLITVLCRALDDHRAGTAGWRFDDGVPATGKSIIHTFASPGWRRVQYEIGGGAGSGTETLAIHPRWVQLEEWRDGLWDVQRKEFLAREWQAAPANDLLAAVSVADRLDDTELLGHLGSACLRRQGLFRPEHLELVSKLANYYQGSQKRDYATAERLCRMALTVAGTNQVARDQARVRLARFLVQVPNKPEEALSLLAGVTPKVLPKDDQRWATLTRGDALLAQGKVGEARNQYVAAGNLVDTANVQQSVRIATRIEWARSLVARGEFDPAAEALTQIQWETPPDRLSLNVGLALVEAYLGRKEYPLAAASCQRLLNVASVDTHRADLLYFLIEASLATNQKDFAADLLAKLLKDHPYSEAAAKAKDKWGTGGPRSTTDGKKAK